MTGAGPCAGITVVEVAVGVSDLGLGLAGGVPGMVLADLGAEVTRVVGSAPMPLDDDVPWRRVWHRDKRLVATDDPAEVRDLLARADVALVYGPEELVEGRGLGHVDLRPANPRLVHARCRPSRTATGTVADYGLLVEARNGFCTQLAGHRPGPVFVDVRAPGAGASFLLTTSVLALLRRRALTGEGGWAETSLYDGMLATLGCMIGRSERAAPEVEGYWTHGSTFPNFLYRCADGELIQVWFGGKGMYPKIIEVLGEEPSREGYYTDQATGQLGVRAAGWHSIFVTEPRDTWIERLRAAGVACEPVLAPGEALADPDLVGLGLAVTDTTDGGHHDVLAATPIFVTPFAEPEPLFDDADGPHDKPAGPPDGADGRFGGVDDLPGGVGGRFGEAAGSQGGVDGRFGEGAGSQGGVGGRFGEAAGPHGGVGGSPGGAGGWSGDGSGSPGGVGGHGRVPGGGPGLLSGVKVADFSAFVAGPLAAEVLADLGAEVVKIEPPGGEAMRGAAYAIAACQRGKRSIAMDVTVPEARPVVERLLRWADVVLHNFRGGVAERLGIDEATVAELNPGAVHGHVRAFGATGPRARFPGNDALMQALTGFEWGLGGAGNDPIGATWIPIDMTGAWVGATGLLAGLHARAATGRGQQVATSLLGAGMVLHSGVFQRDGEIVRGPEVDAEQTGYGAGYRLYRAGDGGWFALVLPDPAAWARLRALVPDLPAPYAPLRGPGSNGDARRAEAVLEAAFAAAPAADWLTRLRAADLLVEPVAEVDRDKFRRGILDDPVNRQLGRVVAYETDDWGHFEQIGPLLRCGPDADGGPPLMLPGVGEHTTGVLADLGFTAEEIDALVQSKAVRRPEPTAVVGEGGARG